MWNSRQAREWGVQRYWKADSFAKYISIHIDNKERNRWEQFVYTHAYKYMYWNYLNFVLSACLLIDMKDFSLLIGWGRWCSLLIKVERWIFKGIFGLKYMKINHLQGSKKKFFEFADIYNCMFHLNISSPQIHEIYRY